MKERDIRKKALEVLTADGYISWWPSPVRWKKEIDIFGVFDIVAVKHLKVPRFIQITSLGNISARKHKVLKVFGDNLMPLASLEVWGFNKKKKVFKIIVLN